MTRKFRIFLSAVLSIGWISFIPAANGADITLSEYLAHKAELQQNITSLETQLSQAQSNLAMVTDSRTAVTSQYNSALGVFNDKQTVKNTAYQTLQEKQAALTTAQTNYNTQLIPAENQVATIAGIKATVYNNYGYNNAPPLPPARPIVRETVVPNINFQWGSGQILNSGYSEDVIVKFEGYITSPITKSIQFYGPADDGVKLIINGVEIINDWYDKGGGGTTSAEISFTAGVSKPFTYWYYENGGGAWTQFFWDLNGSMEIVPASALSQNQSAELIKDPALKTILDAAQADYDAALATYTAALANFNSAKDALDAIIIIKNNIESEYAVAQGTISSLTSALAAARQALQDYLRYLNAPQNLVSEGMTENDLRISWQAPAASNLSPERYAIFFSYDNWQTGYAVATGNVGDQNALNTSITLYDLPDSHTVSIKIRADNDTFGVYSGWSNEITITTGDWNAQEAARLAAIAEQQRLAAIAAEQARLAAIAAEQARIAAEQEAARQAAIAAEQARQAELARLAAIEAQKARLAAEAEALRREQERQKLEAEKKAAEEAARKAEEEARLAEKARIKAEEEARIAEEERLKAEEEARIAEQERIKAEKEARLAEEAKKKAEEEARIAEEEKKKQEELARIAEEERLKAEKDRLKAEAEAKAKAEENARIEAEKKAAEEARIKAEEEAKLAEEKKLKAEADAKADAELKAKQEAAAKAKAEAERIAAEKAKNETTKEEVKQAVAAVITGNTITQAQAKEVVNTLMSDGNVSKAEVANLVEVLTADGGKLNNSEKELVADALLAQADGEALSAEQIKDSGIEYKDLPKETPVDVRTDENGNAVVITAEVAAQTELLQDPAALLSEAFSDPGAALAALGSVGADMSPAEREEATNMVVATVVATGAAMNAVAAAATTTTGGSSSGSGGSSGGSGNGTSGSRRNERW